MKKYLIGIELPNENDACFHCPMVKVVEVEEGDPFKAVCIAKGEMDISEHYYTQKPDNCPLVYIPDTPVSNFLAGTVSFTNNMFFKVERLEAKAVYHVRTVSFEYGTLEVIRKLKLDLKDIIVRRSEVVISFMVKDKDSMFATTIPLDREEAFNAYAEKIIKNETGWKEGEPFEKLDNLNGVDLLDEKYICFDTEVDAVFESMVYKKEKQS